MSAKTGIAICFFILGGLLGLLVGDSIRERRRDQMTVLEATGIQFGIDPYAGKVTVVRNASTKRIHHLEWNFRRNTEGPGRWEITFETE